MGRSVSILTTPASIDAPARDVELLGRRTGGQLERDRGVRGGSHQLIGRALGDEPAVGEHADPIGEVFGLVEVVRRQQHRGTSFAQPLDQFPRLATRNGVEPGGRLVEEQQLGFADDAERQVDPASLASRQRADPGVDLGGQTDHLDDLVDRARIAIAGPVEPERLAHGELLLDPRGLEHDPDPIAEIAPAVGGVGTQHRDGSRAAPAVAFEDLDGGRLAGTVVSEQAVHLAFGDLERDTGYGIGLSVALAQVADFDHRHRQPLP